MFDLLSRREADAAGAAPSPELAHVTPPPPAADTLPAPSGSSGTVDGHPDLDAFVNQLIDALSPAPVPDDDGARTLFHLLDAPRRVLDEPPLLAVLDAAVTLRNLLDHVIASAVAASERLGIPARKHLRSGAGLLTGLGVAPAPAYRSARVGRAAHLLPALTRAQRLGAVGIEFADAIGKGITHITNRVPLSDAELAQVVTKLMVQTTPAAVNNKARAIAIATAPATPPDDTVPVAENTELNEMTLIPGDDGRITGSFDLDVLTGEELQAALDPLCRPVPAPDGSPDPRPAARRRADGFGQLIRHYLSGSSRPASGGVLPHVTLIRPPTSTQHAAATPRTEPAVDMLGFTGPVSTLTADLVSCDCTLDSVHLDGNGAPLDVGRSQRLFPPKIRKALTVRDGGCAFPGCGKPVSWCDAHHIRAWTDNGVTSLDNGVLLCRRHHTRIHHSNWQVYLGTDRHPWFIPPPDPAHPDRQPQHLRSQARRTLTNLPTAA
ncbi:HNH endonuclease signature motif containing protein [Mycolicibacter icosiumassiliensis]|uniref:HNH endonuclease signature motif containing protein n=1 Tax=Mycolicibacter icosiumassiliensis TaxID=1792835 RepID=UPI00098EB9C7|nr:HNH endonuclease signature motif containing protein [Mycolicibacter icosiumassiliensis]